MFGKDDALRKGERLGQDCCLWLSFAEELSHLLQTTTIGKEKNQFDVVFFFLTYQTSCSGESRHLFY